MRDSRVLSSCILSASNVPQVSSRVLWFAIVVPLQIIFATSLTVGVWADESNETSPPPKVLEFIEKCKKAVPESIKSVEEQMRFVRSTRFRATPQQRRELVEQLKSAREDLSDGRTLPVLRIPLQRANVGDIGFFTDGNPNEPATVEVFQILDQDSLLCRHGKRVFWIEVPTADLVDGTSLHLNDVLKVTGTQRYRPVAGGSNTVYRLEKFNIELAKRWFREMDSD